MALPAAKDIKLVGGALADFLRLTFGPIDQLRKWWEYFVAVAAVLGVPAATQTATNDPLATTLVLLGVVAGLLLVAGWRLAARERARKRFDVSITSGDLEIFNQDSMWVRGIVKNNGPTTRFVAHVPRGIEGARIPLTANSGNFKLCWDAQESEECRILQGAEHELRLGAWDERTMEFCFLGPGASGHGGVFPTFYQRFTPTGDLVFTIELHDLDNSKVAPWIATIPIDLLSKGIGEPRFMRRSVGKTAESPLKADA